MSFRFQDRTHAGRILAQHLDVYTNQPDVMVLALPRGGVPVAFEVASALGTPLDVFVVRKLGVPGHEELAMGAIATGGVGVLNQEIVRALRLSNDVIEVVIAQERQELERRERLYRGDRPPLDVRGKTVILIDDGLATGATMYAAAQALQHMQPASIVVAVPIASPDACQAFAAEVDEIVCAVMPERLHSVGLWYEDFSQTTDAEVRALLARSARDQPAHAPGEPGTVSHAGQS